MNRHCLPVPDTKLVMFINCFEPSSLPTPTRGRSPDKNLCVLPNHLVVGSRTSRNGTRAAIGGVEELEERDPGMHSTLQKALTCSKRDDVGS